MSVPQKESLAGNRVLSQVKLVKLGGPLTHHYYDAPLFYDWRAFKKGKCGHGQVYSKKACEDEGRDQGDAAEV